MQYKTRYFNSYSSKEVKIKLTLPQTCPGLYLSSAKFFFENTVGKGEIAHSEQFLLFPQCSLPFWRTFYQSPNLKLLSANCFSLKESKICHLGKG